MAYKDLEKRRQKRREHRERNKEKIRAKNAEYYAENRKEILLKIKQKRDRDRDGYNRRCRDRYLDNPEYQSRRYAKHVADTVATKIKIINRYGGECACCGEGQIAFLVLDHVHGGGNEHRKKLGVASLYNWIDKNGHPEGVELQVLCHNCNMARGHYGFCLHRPDVHVEGEVAERKRREFQPHLMMFKRPPRIAVV